LLKAAVAKVGETQPVLLVELAALLQAMVVVMAALAVFN
jgi:hypothetical protein